MHKLYMYNFEGHVHLYYPNTYLFSLHRDFYGVLIQVTSSFQIIICCCCCFAIEFGVLYVLEIFWMLVLYQTQQWKCFEGERKNSSSIGSWSRVLIRSCVWKKQLLSCPLLVWGKSRLLACTDVLGRRNSRSLFTWDPIYLCDSVQFSSVDQLCPTLCNPMDCSTPGLSLYHQLLESAKTHVYQVGDAFQPSQPLSSPSPPAFNLS